MPTIEAVEDEDAYVSNLYTTKDVMRDIIMMNSVKKSLNRWEKECIKNTEAIDLKDTLAKVSTVLGEYSEYGKDTKRSPLASTFYTVYGNEIVKKAGKTLWSITSNYFLEDIKEDFNEADWSGLYDDLFNVTGSFHGAEYELKDIAQELGGEIAKKFPKKFAKGIRKSLISDIIKQNDDINSFYQVYNELSSYVGSFKQNSLISQAGGSVLLPMYLLQTYVDIMKMTDEIFRGQYFMIQYSLLRYYPEQYDLVIDNSGNVIDYVDFIQSGIESSFISEEIENWYSRGASVQLSGNDKIMLGNVASQVLMLQQSNPLAMKQKLVEYWVDEVVTQKRGEGFFQTDILLDSDDVFVIKNQSGEIVGYYSDKKFSKEKPMSVDGMKHRKSIAKSSDGDDEASRLFESEDLLIELSEDASLVHIVMKNDYECIVDNAEDVLYVSCTTDHEEHAWKYSELPKEISITTNNKEVRVTDNKGEALIDDVTAEELGLNIPEYDDGVITKPATCTEDGIITYTDKKKPSNTKTEIIPALGHDWDDDFTVDKEATDSQDGQKSIHCKRCDEKKEITVLPKLTKNTDKETGEKTDSEKQADQDGGKSSDSASEKDDSAGQESSDKKDEAGRESGEEASDKGASDKGASGTPSRNSSHNASGGSASGHGASNGGYASTGTPSNGGTSGGSSASQSGNTAKGSEDQTKDSTGGEPAANGSSITHIKGDIIEGGIGTSAGKYKITPTKKGKETVSYIAARTEGIIITIPDTISADGTTYKVTKVAASSLRKNTVVKKVKIGDNVLSIGESAFQGCSQLKVVSIGKSLTTIGKKAFYGCKSIRTIRLNADNLSKVGDKAFENTAKGAAITILAKGKSSYNKSVSLMKKSGIKKGSYHYKKS